MKKLSKEQAQWLIKIFADKACNGQEFLQKFSKTPIGECHFGVEAIEKVINECVEAPDFRLPINSGLELRLEVCGLASHARMSLVAMNCSEPRWPRSPNFSLSVRGLQQHIAHCQEMLKYLEDAEKSSSPNEDLKALRETLKKKIELALEEYEEAAKLLNDD